MRVLLTFLHPDPSGVALARRSVPYDQLILLSTSAQADRAKELLESENRTTRLETQRPRVVSLDSQDPTAALRTIENLLDELRGHDVTFNIAAASPPLTYAALLACLRFGRPAHFFLHDRASQLPVLRGLRLVQSFEQAEIQMMIRINDDDHVRTLSKGLRPLAVDRILASLKQKGVIRLVTSEEGVRARFTPEGLYYIEQVQDIERSQRPANQGTDDRHSVGHTHANDALQASVVRLVRPSSDEPWGKQLLARPRVRSVRPAKPRSVSTFKYSREQSNRINANSGQAQTSMELGRVGRRSR